MTAESIPVVQIGARWIAKSSYQQKDIVKAAGFRWDPANKCWYTTNADVAASLANPDAAERIKKAQAEKAAAKEQAIAASRAADADIDIPVPEGLAYLPFQRAGIAYMAEHLSALNGDDMGLGKTIQTAGVINSDDSLNRILVICLASLRLNWKREFEKWVVRRRTIGVVTGPAWIEAEITIINYDLLAKHTEKLQATQWDLVVLDEAHYCKSRGAQRTRAIFGFEPTRKELAAYQHSAELLAAGKELSKKETAALAKKRCQSPEKHPWLRVRRTWTSFRPPRSAESSSATSRPQASG